MNTDTQTAALEIECPLCQAGPDHKCIRKGTDDVTLLHPHSERVNARRATLVKTDPPAALTGIPSGDGGAVVVVEPGIGKDTSSAGPAKDTGKPAQKAAEAPKHDSCGTCGYVFDKPRQQAKCNTKSACDRRVIENAAAGIDAAKRAKQGGDLSRNAEDQARQGQQLTRA